MNHILLIYHGITISSWKIIGYLGVLVFASRWLVQMYTSKKAGRPVMTLWFWLISLSGSSLLFIYFFFGKNDSVGIISNLFPIFVALYNIFLETRYRNKQKQDRNDVDDDSLDVRA